MKEFYGKTTQEVYETYCENARKAGAEPVGKVVFVKAFLRFCVNYLFVRNVTKRQLCRVLLQKNAVWQNLLSDKRCDKFFLANFVLTLSF